MTAANEDMPVSAEPAIWGIVPKQNRNFTGREEILARLRRGSASRITAVLPDEEQRGILPQAVQGLGGVGKTAIAIEYAYRHKSDYDVIWWIPADQLASVRSSLAQLASRMRLDTPAAGGIEAAIPVVLAALRQGEPYKRWLLIFDNADQPEEITELIPRGPGDVLVTSRNQRWQSEGVVALPMDVFTRRESIEFLGKRVPRELTEGDADRLAEELGDLPLALDQAGAMLAETGISVDEYLRLLEAQVSRLMSEENSPDYPSSMTAAWAISVSSLERQFPPARRLLRLCAFFGPDAIPTDVFRRGADAAGEAVAEVLSDPILFSRALQELGRFSLVTVDGRSVTVHRLVQALLRDEMTAEEASRYRRDVHLIMADAAPTNPDDQRQWPGFRDLLPHVAAEVTELPASRETKVRALARRMMRYADQSGDYESCIALARRFIARWTEDSGPDSPDVLRAQRHLGNALRLLGRFRESATLTKETLDRATAVLGESDPTTLSLRAAFAADLRANGDFKGALASDEASRVLFDDKYGPRDSRSLRQLANLALDYGLNGRFDLAKDRYKEASRYMTRAGSDSTDADKLGASIGLGWALRHLGEYQAALDVLQTAREDPGILEPEHIASLRSANCYVIVCRRIPERRQEALRIARSIYALSSRLFGDEHPDTLAIAISLSSLLRSISPDHHPEALELAESVVEHYPRAYGATHPYNYGCLSNLAILKRVTGDFDGAYELNKRALDGLEARIGLEHHYSLTVAMNLASDLAGRGLHEEARDLGTKTRDRLSRLLGPDHPLTLGSAVNLSVDQAATGDEEGAERLRRDALARFRDKLGPEHPDTVVAVKGGRLDPDFDPPPI